MSESQGEAAERQFLFEFKIKEEKMKKLIVLLFVPMLLVNCGSKDGDGMDADRFDRAAMLTNWADNLIIPAFSDFVTQLQTMDDAVAAFSASPSTQNLTDLRTAWLDAYKAWQWVDMYDIGKAEKITLRNYINVYPVASADMVATLLSGSYDLSSVNRQDEQGFPALDYLLHGLAETDEAIVAFYTDGTDGAKYKQYLKDVSARMLSLSQSVLDDWTGGYRDTFVDRSGSSATESVNKLVNDYLFYYEKHLRAGKVGIPAGVFSTNPLPDRVEALYSGHSKVLFNEALDAAQAFFNGIHFGNTTDGISLDDYLLEVNAVREGEDLAALIDGQFSTSRTAAIGISDDFSTQVGTNNTLMLQAYDALQANVVYMKVDMLQALNINVDYVDGDGD